VHAISLQTVPAGYLSHAPVPSHIPVEPHVDAASTGTVARIGPDLRVDAGADGALAAQVMQVPCTRVAADAVGAEPAGAFAAHRARRADRLAGTSMPMSVGVSRGASAGVRTARRRPAPRRALSVPRRDPLLAAAAAARDPGNTPTEDDG
jgi:hypothetical protein